ncbi:conjugal transfer protein TraB [Sinorhizobium meliloti]|uniref:conjugal transfer protein TraB n=1 Tax=Rhizobium meliloti TaxID=382 RepID=UPI000FDC69C7|nr:conjugal transfer protein TraB [Sinorhizobium meliloti]RVH83314.1 conjugal transfer protein TraB [Sinorhizobium meliloti]RVM25682.1 conjugal transfer protein TraB [Sinorhizobium meliloti]RVO03862.1 conjugal transfer protein TraB [Sinorhizobium meliloti]
MRRNFVLSLALVLASGASGYLGWSGYALTLPAATAFPALWSKAQSRQAAGLVAAAYFLAASRRLPQGVAAFYQSDIWPGLILWLTASIGFVFLHSILWSPGRDNWSALRYSIVMIVMAVPPFGIVGWAHPLTAAGVLLPGWGWAGLAAMAAGLAIMTTRYWPAAAITFAGLWLWSAAFWTTPNLGQHWQGVDLALGNSLGRDNSLVRHSDLAATVLNQRRDSAAVILLPESTLGFWTPTVERFWRTRLARSGLTVVAGAAIVGPGGYDNVLISISGHGAEVMYNERMPVPGSMWQPWLSFVGRDGGARAHFFANPVAPVGNSLTAPLICYELLLIWPILQSMIYEPDLIVAAGNGWWTKGTNIVAIQRASAVAWARLFDKPLVMSFNM